VIVRVLENTNNNNSGQLNKNIKILLSEFNREPNLYSSDSAVRSVSVAVKTYSNLPTTMVLPIAYLKYPRLSVSI
jgi:hypothetical protein